VVLLDQHGVEEPEPVVVAAARQHGLLLEHPHPRGRLACVEDASARPLHGAHVERGQRGDAGQAGQEVERDALAGKDRPRRAGHLRHQATLAPFGLGGARVPAELRVHAAKHGLRHRQAGDHAVSLLLDPGAPSGAIGHEGQAGDVRLADILGERSVDQLLHAESVAESAVLA
jgi:hypothetical protein